MSDQPPASCPLPGSGTAGGRVTLGHGAGGRLSNQLINDLFLRHLGNDELARLEDAARLQVPAGRIAFSTDTFVVQPLFFPGGDIGRLAVHGTVNDLAMQGAEPRWLSAGFVIEEGFPVSDLERIAGSMATAARQAGVAVVTGDTKVVGRGQCDGLFINTAGVGIIAPDIDWGIHRIQAGDRVLVSGPIGNHGMAVMLARGALSFTSTIASDTAALSPLTTLLQTAGLAPAIHALRDATRGGLGAVLAEFAQGASLSIHIDPAAIPVDEAVAAACDLLGIDPLFVANEGVMTLVVAADQVDAVLQACRAHPLGRRTAVIGTVTTDHPGQLVRRTPFGAPQVVPLPAGELLPRIC